MATATATLRKMFIDGQWCAAQDGKSIGVINPATEEVVADMAFGSRADVKRALEAAAKAMTSWMKLTPWDRAKVLKKTAELMRERADAIAKTLTMEQGKPLAESKAETLHSANHSKVSAECRTSAFDSARGLPCSVVSVRAMASARSRISSAVFLSTLARSQALSFIQAGMAFAAASTARRVSARPP